MQEGRDKSFLEEMFDCLQYDLQFYVSAKLLFHLVSSICSMDSDSLVGRSSSKKAQGKIFS